MKTFLQTTECQALTAGVDFDAIAANEWLGNLNVSAASLKTYARALADFYRYKSQRGLTLAQIDRAALVDYLNNFLAGKSTATRALRCQALKLFFEFLENTHNAKNIARGMKIKDATKGFKKEFLTVEQAKALLAATDGESIQNKRDRAMLAVMLTTGARVGEIQNADVGDLEKRGEQLVLKIRGKGHTEKDAFLKITPQVAGILAAYLDARGETPANTQSPLFVSHSHRTDGQRISHRAISGIVKSTMRGQGIDSPLFTAHSLRHTAAVTALENGASLADTQIFLRHTSPTITMRYTHGIEARKNQCAEKVANAFF